MKMMLLFLLLLLLQVKDSFFSLCRTQVEYKTLIDMYGKDIAWGGQMYRNSFR